MGRSLKETRHLIQQNPWTEPLLWFALAMLLGLQGVSGSHPEPGTLLTGYGWLVVGVGWLVMNWIQLRMPRWHSVLRWLPIWLMGVIVFILACQIFMFVRSLFE